MNGRYYDFALLNAWLKESGWTYPQLHVKTGISVAVIKRAATGGPVSYKVLCNLCAVLGRPVKDLLYAAPLSEDAPKKKKKPQKNLPLEVS